ncbi:nucleoporin FG repeat region-domain-containing protein [Bisporella sp. PMI_857]|nr:nucleoporin FG repeat region-domain-containing protein [Bisporella sp. PMI_857]
MALSRSLSGPAGLSINTTAANSPFGTTSGTAPAAGGMFGSTQAASKPLFGALTTTTAPQTGGLFGSTTSTTGGLFGSTATSQPQAQSGGLFGSTATSQPQAQSGGLFGSTTATSQPATGGLFGSTTATTQPQTGGLFGATQAQSQPQAAGGLFPSLGSSISQTTNQNTTGGMFGATNNQPSQGGGLFGGLNTQNQNKPASSLFGGLGNTQSQPQNQQPQQQGLGQSRFMGGLTMGPANQHNQQTVPGVKISTENLRGTTRFEDLHENLQQNIEYMDNVIQGFISKKLEIDAILPAHDDNCSRIPPDVEFCRRKQIGVEASLTADVDAIAHVKNLNDIDIENSKLSFKAIDRLKLPPQYHTPGVWHKSTTSPNQNRGSTNTSSTASEARDIVSFFSSTADELSGTLAKYQSNIKEIELHLRNVEASSAQQINALIAKRNGNSEGRDAGDAAIRELAGALTEFEQGILHVAGKVGGAREGMQTLQLGAFTGPSHGRSVNGQRRGIY